jgi:NADPH:quinone reductase-like Zn-dependent oxidoreductase
VTPPIPRHLQRALLLVDQSLPRLSLWSAGGDYPRRHQKARAGRERGSCPGQGSRGRTLGRWIRAGKSALPQPLPLTLGADLSGIVEAVGAKVTAFASGDHVFGVTNPRFVGAYAEFAVASADMIAKKPTGLGDIDAASVPVVAVTAWQALFEQADLARGQTVLIHGAAGNVGAYAVQLARQAGLQVIGTAGSDDLAYVRSLGAQQVIDAGELRTNVGTVLPFTDARTAHEMLEGSRPHPRGKIVLSIGV